MRRDDQSLPSPARPSSHRSSKSRRRASRLAIAGLLSAIAASSLGAGAAQAAYVWTDGTIQESVITNCVSIIQGFPYTEFGAGSYTGVYVNPSALPAVGDTYYAHVVVAGLGNACAGMYAHIEAVPPPNTDFAVSQGTPVQCFLTLPNRPSQRDTVDCPAQPSQGQYGGAFDPLNNQGKPWPLPRGSFVEVQFPLVSHRAQHGIGASPCDCLHGATKIIDGNSSPWLFPSEGVFVEPASAGGATAGGGPPGATTPTGDMPSGKTPQGMMAPGGIAPSPSSAPAVTSPPVTGPVLGNIGSSGSLLSFGAPSSFSIPRGLKAGIPVTVENRYGNSTDDLTLVYSTGLAKTVSEAKAAVKTLAHLVKTHQRAGKVTLKLKLSKSAMRFLKGKKAKVTLLVTVTSPGHQPSTERQVITLKRR